MWKTQGYFAGLAMLAATAAYAHWGSADPQAAENCASCHFDSEAALDSPLIEIFIDDRPVSLGEGVNVHVQFMNMKHKKAGFQIIASQGKFVSESEDIESNGVQARAILPRYNSSLTDNLLSPQICVKSIGCTSNVLRWKLKWMSPAEADGDVKFSIAVNASNDDQSAFGDQIHFKTVIIQRPGDFWLLPPQ